MNPHQRFFPGNPWRYGSRQGHREFPESSDANAKKSVKVVLEWPKKDSMILIVFMRITNPYTTTLTPYRPNLDSSLDKRFEHFQSFRSALQAGDIAGTQQAFPAFQNDMLNRLENFPGGGTLGANKQAIADLQKLGQSLGTGDISAMRQAFAVLKHSLKAFSSGAGSPASDSSAAAAPLAVSKPEPKGSMLNVYA